MRDVTIKPALNGFVVRVGCQRVVFTSRENMFKALREYFDSPDKVEDQWKFGSTNSKQLGFAQGPSDLSIKDYVGAAKVPAYASSEDSEQD